MRHPTLEFVTLPFDRRKPFLSGFIVGLIILMATRCAFGGDIITATVTISTAQATNLVGTNAASITISSDTRIWTNSVTSASTQILATTNASTAAFRLLQHLRAYPFTDVATTATNSGVVLVGDEGAALSITISNSWATVAYRTNTVGTGIVYRAPRSIESATTRAIVDDDVVTRINNASTNTVTASAASMVNFVDTSEAQTVAGAKDFTSTGNIFSGKYVQLAHSALAVDSAGTNFVVDLTNNAYRTITATNDVNFIQSTNRAAVRTTVVRIDPNGTNRNLSFNASWSFLGTRPTNIISTNIGVLTVVAFGTAETDILAAYSVEYGGSGGSGLQSTDIDTSAEIAAIVTDETGTGALVLATSPTLVTPTLGVATATTLDTGQGANELFDMDQNVLQASAVTFATVDTGQGANELYDMDQNVLVASSPTFAAVTVGAEVYDATGWNGDLTVATKDDIRDKIEALVIGGGLGSGDIDTSAELRGIVTDESGTGALLFADGAIGAATATSAAANDDDTSVATTEWVQDELTAYASDTVVFTGKTFDAAGTGNVLKFTDYKDFIYPGRVDGTGCIAGTTNTANVWGLASYSGSADTNGNYAVFRVGTVPYDLDTSVAMTLKGFSIRVDGSDTDAAQFAIALYSPASSAAAMPSDFTACSDFIHFDSGALTTPALGDVFYFSDVTLTGWAAALTAGRPLIVAVARRNGSNDDIVSIVSGTIEYGRTK
jgi:hypothetical protein